ARKTSTKTTAAASNRTAPRRPRCAALVTAVVVFQVPGTSGHLKMKLSVPFLQVILPMGIMDMTVTAMGDPGSDRRNARHPRSSELPREGISLPSRNMISASLRWSHPTLTRRKIVRATVTCKKR
ncbi:unnamed protein product, partial [Sphacelaria rigidula]